MFKVTLFTTVNISWLRDSTIGKRNIFPGIILSQIFHKKIKFSFENIISGMQLYNKYHQKLNHFQETEKDD